MLTWIELIVFLVILGLTIYGFFSPLILRIKLMKLGRPETSRSRNLAFRIWDAISSFFFLRCSVKKERVFTGLIHVGILYGSLTFDTVSVNHILEGFKEGLHFLGHGQLRQIYTVWVDVFAILVIAATFYFIIRRYVLRPKSYTYTTNESILIYLLLLTVTLTFLLYEGAAIAREPEFAHNAFIGTAVAAYLPSSAGLVKAMWWLHMLNVFAFIVYVPRSKYQHMFMGPINIALKNDQPWGIVKKLDIENSERFGIATLRDFTWKDLLDGFACVDCGRCEDYCPAAATDKALSPKTIILKMRDRLLQEGPELLKQKDLEAKPVMDDPYKPDEIWACTTCGNCMQVCPVLNEQVPKIIGMRQAQVLMNATFPHQLKQVFTGMTNNANPWGLGADKRMAWAEGLNVPLFPEKPDAEYLLYLGCAAAFDDRAQKMTRSLIQFLQKQGISFGILGQMENCCGETARRLGEEAVGQMLVQGNIELFKELKVKKIITPCPHCFNTLKNEYPLFGGEFEVIHHSQLIVRLMSEGKIKIEKQDQSGTVVVHDSCYLGRFNHVYEEPRNILKRLTGLKIQEHERSRDHGFCCGAGGGMFWLEEKEPRINHERTKQLASLNPDWVATFCPYCLKMLDDGVKDLNLNHVKVRDIVEILN